MKKITLILLLIILSYSSKAQWVQLPGPGGIDVYSMYADGNNIWAGTGKCLFLTTNNGTSWVQRASGIYLTMFGPYPYSTLVNGSYMFTGISGAGIYVSTNYGLNWVPCNNGVTSSSTIYALVKQNNVVIAGGSSGVYLTTNNGTTWIRPFSSWPSYVRCFLKIGNSLYAGAQSGIYLSTDNGYDWTIPLFSNSIIGLTASNTTMYAATTGSVYASTDNGITWVLRSNGLSGSLTALASMNDTLFAGTSSSGLYQSSNGGLNWFQTGPGIYYPQITGIAISSGKIFVGSYYRAGVFLSTNKGVSWTDVNNGLWNNGIFALATSNNIIYAGTEYMGVHMSTDYGNSWKILYPQLPIGRFNAVATNGSNSFAGNSYNVYRSSNNGSNWSAVYSGNCNSLAIINNNIYAGLSNAIIRSTDSGLNWVSVLTNSVYSFANIGTTIYAGSGNGQILRSTDNGINWNIILSGGFSTVRGLACYNNYIFAATSSGFYKSTDLGVTWIVSNSGLGSTSISSMAMFSQNILVVSDNIYLSTNYGGNWTIVSYGLIGSNPQRIATSGPYAFVGTFDLSVWRRPLAELVGIDHDSKRVISEFNLYQNYPNPFNPGTTIEYDVKKTSDVKLEIYDVTGKSIVTLVNAKQQNGNYRVRWDAGDYPSGIYFYKLTAGNFVSSKKMLFIK